MIQTRVSARRVRINRTMPLALIAAAGLAFVATSAVAAPENYAVDPAHSAVGFTVRHLFRGGCE